MGWFKRKYEEKKAKIKKEFKRGGTKVKKEVKRTIKKVKEDPVGLAKDVLIDRATQGISTLGKIGVKAMTPDMPEEPELPGLDEDGAAEDKVPTPDNVADAVDQDTEIQDQLRRQVSVAKKKDKPRQRLGRAANILTGYSGLSMSTGESSGLARKSLMGY